MIVTLDRVKIERKDQGIRIASLESENNAYKAVNIMQAQLLTENNITALEYKTDGTYGAKIETKKVELIE